MVERRIRLLLVEDDPDDVWVMRNLLGDRWDEPFDLVQVELLAAAVERCTEEAFDVILLDLNLPDSRGLQTFFTVQAHAAEVPIVVLTGHNDEQSAMKAVQAGAQDYLVKGQVNDRLLVAFDPLRHRAQPASSGRGRDARHVGRVSRRPGNSAASVSGRGPLPARLRHRRGDLLRPNPPPATISTTSPCSTTAWGSSSATSAAMAWAPPC